MRYQKVWQMKFWKKTAYICSDIWCVLMGCNTYALPDK